MDGKIGHLATAPNNNGKHAWNVEEDPHSRWWVDLDHKDNDKIHEFLRDIYYDCIIHVYEYLTDKVGIDVKEEFKDYLNLWD